MGIFWLLANRPPKLRKCRFSAGSEHELLRYNTIIRPKNLSSYVSGEQFIGIIYTGNLSTHQGALQSHTDRRLENRLVRCQKDSEPVGTRSSRGGKQENPAQGARGNPPVLKISEWRLMAPKRDVHLKASFEVLFCFCVYSTKLIALRWV